jgi:hypothetical protein
MTHKVTLVRRLSCRVETKRVDTNGLKNYLADAIDDLLGHGVLRRGCPSPNHFDALIELELVVRGYNRGIFGQRLRDDLAVKGIGVLRRQTEEMVGVVRGIRQYADLEIRDACARILYAEIQLA